MDVLNPGEKVNSDECMAFISQLNVAIDGYRLQLLSNRKVGEQFLVLEDMRTITLHVKNYFLKKLNFLPKEIELTCDLALIPFASNVTERVELIKKLASIAAGATGFASILLGFGIALGWSAGVVESLIGFFCGTSLLGPIGWIVGGTTAIVIAGLMYLNTSDKFERSEKGLNGLKEGLRSAVIIIWPQGDNALKLSAK